MAGIYQHPCNLRNINREQVDNFWRQVFRPPRHFLWTDSTRHICWHVLFFWW